MAAVIFIKDSGILHSKYLFLDTKQRYLGADLVL